MVAGDAKLKREIACQAGQIWKYRGICSARHGEGISHVRFAISRDHVLEHIGIKS